jgi:hypothetical protein
MILRLLFKTIILILLLSSCQAGKRHELAKEIQNAHAFEEHERDVYAKAVAYFHGMGSEKTFPNTELTRVNGAMKTSDRGWQIVRFLEQNPVDRSIVHDELFRAATRFGLEHWLYTTVKAIEPAWLLSLSETAKLSLQPPSPFLPAEKRK